jgi:hypothetical protein
VKLRVYLVIVASSVLVGLGVGLIVYSQVTQAANDRASREFAHDHNAFICVFRKLILPARARSVQTALDHTQSESVQARARASVKSDDDLLAALITIPRKLDCSKFKP